MDPGDAGIGEDAGLNPDIGSSSAPEPTHRFPLVATSVLLLSAWRRITGAKPCCRNGSAGTFGHVAASAKSRTGSFTAQDV